MYTCTYFLTYLCIYVLTHILNDILMYFLSDESHQFLSCSVTSLGGVSSSEMDSEYNVFLLF